MILILTYLLMVIWININLACYNNDTLEETQPVYHTTTELSYNYGMRYGELLETMTAPQIPIQRIKYRTIICSHIFSTDSVFYSYAEEDFEQHLKFESSSIPIIKQGTFMTFSTITSLFLTNMNIKTILPGAFNGLTRLKELHLSDNKLEEISKGVFNSLHRLETLTLNNNELHYIEDMAFTGTDSLVTLYLHNNNLETFEKSLLKTQKHLSRLDLSQNPLVNVSLEGISSLDSLNISHSMLEEFSDNLSHLTMGTLDLAFSNLSNIDFSLFPRLNELNLSNNKIESLYNCGDLVCLRLNLSYNDIDVINGTFGDVSHFVISHNHIEILENFLFNKSDTVFSIDFSFNNISTVEAYAFLGLSFLDKLHLQYNHISKIDTILFKDLRNLRDLNLSHNNLQDFQYGTFDSLSNLETLDVSANKLKDLHQLTFNSLAHLNNLYFDSNHISTIDAKNLKNHLVNLYFVSMDNNPWKCEELVTVAQVFKSVNVRMKEGRNYNVENFHGIACQNDKHFTNSLDNYKTVDENVRDSKLEQFFNKDFHKSKFVQYFEKEYSQSGFFKYLNGYRFVTPNSLNSTDNQMEKLIAFQNVSNDEKKILMFSAICQVLIVCTLVISFFYMSSYLKKLRYLQQTFTTKH